MNERDAEIRDEKTVSQSRDSGRNPRKVDCCEHQTVTAKREHSIQNEALMEIILETAIQDDKVMQDFDLESLLMGADHFLWVKAAPIESDYGSKGCVNLPFSIAVSRIMLGRANMEAA